MTNSTFKFDRYLKRMVCLVADKTKANAFKQVFIDAQVSEQKAKQQKFKAKEGSEE